MPEKKKSFLCEVFPNLFYHLNSNRQHKFCNLEQTKTNSNHCNKTHPNSAAPPNPNQHSKLLKDSPNCRTWWRSLNLKQEKLFCQSGWGERELDKLSTGEVFSPMKLISFLWLIKHIVNNFTLTVLSSAYLSTTLAMVFGL